MKTCRIRGSVLTAVALALSCVAAVASAPTLHVIFADGRALEVEGYEVEGERAILTLPGGGMLAVPASRIARVEGAQAPSAREDGASSSSPGPAAIDEESAAAGDEQESLTVDSIVRAAAAKYGLEPQLLAAVIAVESGYRTNAVSPKGAQGLMQLMPATASDLSVTDPFDPEQNIDGGARYLKQLLDQHGDSFVEALAAYNAGAGRVARYKGIPPYKETIEYIRRVLDQYESRLNP
jgi:soluble lytic murein transglycosylase-like protein